MHDLFLRLGISTAASADEIAAAIASKPHQAAASDILLNPHRRAAYQRTVFTLRAIGELRHRLGLDSDTSWFDETCGDFSSHAQARKFTAKAETAADASAHALPSSNASSGAPSGTGHSVQPGTQPGPVASATASPTPPRSRLKLLLVVAAVLAALAVVWVVNFV